jgi:hypothetical protein
MFEIKEGFDYSLYNTTLNPDVNTWKRYETVLSTNKNGLKEFKIDMKDVILNGTSDSTEAMPVIIPRF